MDRDELEKCLKHLLKARDYNRKRRAILDQEAGRFARIIKPDPVETEDLSPPERTSRPSRPWLTRARARQALGPRRRSWLTPEDKVLRTSRLQRRYELEDRDPAPTATERRADFHAFVQEELDKEKGELHLEDELTNRDEQVRKRIVSRAAGEMLMVLCAGSSRLSRQSTEFDAIAQVCALLQRQGCMCARACGARTWPRCG